MHKVPVLKNSTIHAHTFVNLATTDVWFDMVNINIVLTFQWIYISTYLY